MAVFKVVVILSIVAAVLAQEGTNDGKDPATQATVVVANVTATTDTAKPSTDSKDNTVQAQTDSNSDGSHHDYNVVSIDLSRIHQGGGHNYDIHSGGAPYDGTSGASYDNNPGATYDVESSNGGYDEHSGTTYGASASSGGGYDGSSGASFEASATSSGYDGNSGSSYDGSSGGSYDHHEHYYHHPKYHYHYAVHDDHTKDKKSVKEHRDGHHTVSEYKMLEADHHSHRHVKIVVDSKPVHKHH